jgi:hypothetical protein
MKKFQKQMKKKKIGQMALDAAIEGAKMYAGAGNYNDLFAEQTNTDSTPTVQTVSDETGDMVITHTEYIGEVYGNGLLANGSPNLFESNKLVLNPGMEKTFPWLSQIAQNYQEYEFDQLVFKYTPQLAEVSSNNGQVGQVLIVTQYKPNAGMFKDKSDVMNYNHYSIGKTTEDIHHGVECDPEKLPLQKATMYVRNQDLSADESINDFDWGFTQICVHNTPATLADASVGSLEVYYTVKLSKPIVKTSKGEGISTSVATTGINPPLRINDDSLEAAGITLYQGAHNNEAVQPRIRTLPIYANNQDQFELDYDPAINIHAITAIEGAVEDAQGSDRDWETASLL